MSSFRLERVVTTPAEFHGRDLLATMTTPAVVVVETISDALVLGSAQSLDVVDVPAAAVAGVEVVRRRSGGGAVLVQRGAMTWFDVVVPAGADAVPDDVTASMRWLGHHVATALDHLGVAGAAVHDGPMATTTWSRLVCFDGVAPGEVVVAATGPAAKLVGVSQRRTRAGARFQCMVHHRWAPAVLLELLRDPKPRVADLAPVAVLPAEVATQIPAALVAAL